ncbi:DUF808 domain-containing protein [Cellulomonas composti]|uniref:ABC transporter n=1 Tax=Cellulomonas composti TaxID=266130 RepID=A0A511JDF7_9CELL|nr:DUF808 domain-containing protein [Cellulomonas composti]GEL96015.1 ABC transporter [Cellulomonas composti]
MAGGLAALLDDIAALAKLAAASVDDVGAAAGRASVKAAGVVVDDTAVTPRYVEGVTPARELPIIWKIARGSLRNKLLFILPGALLLSQFLPWLLTPILMVGGTYLAFEGAEKLWEAISGGHHDEPVVAREAAEEAAAAADAAAAPVESAEPLESADPVESAEPVESATQVETRMVSSAIRTDFILSAEIMVIALNEVADEPLVSRAIILAVVALVITALVYGVVALIVKMDDIGLRLARTSHGATAATGRALVNAMPRVLAVLSTVGIVAMLWVGGHILLAGLDELGWHAPFDVVHHLEHAVHDVAVIGPFLSWLVGTLASAVVGLVVGAVVVAVLHVLPRRRRSAGAGH